jgi:hypothetical protein
MPTRRDLQGFWEPFEGLGERLAGTLPEGCRPAVRAGDDGHEFVAPVSGDGIVGAEHVPLTGYSVLASTRGGWLFLVWARR